MTKKITFLITAALMLLTMMATTGTMWGQSDYSTTYTSNVTLPTSGTQTSSCVVVIGSTNYSGTKLGKSGAGGSASITAPAGTKYIHLHVAAWNGKSPGFTYKVGTGTAQSISGITSNSGIASNSPFTWGTGNNDQTPNSTSHYKVITLSSALTEATSITFASTSERVVFWGVNTEAAGSSTTPSITAADVNIDYDATNGSIAYTIDNAVTGGTLTASTQSTWLTPGSVTNSAVPFTCEANEGAERSATVTLTYTYTARATVTKNVTITQAGNPNAPGTENNPYTVAEAIAATPTSGTSSNVYIHGIVSAFYNTSIVGDGSNYRYYISDDGTTTNQLLVYKGKGLNNVAFSNANDLLIGDIVTIYGGLTTFSNAPEIASGNYLTSLEHPAVDVEAPVITPASCGLETSMDVTITPADGTTIYYTTDGSDPDNSGTGYITMQTIYGISETTTVKAIAYIGEQHSNVVSAVYTKITDIENITAVNTTYFVKGTVVATNSRGYVIGDGSEYVYVYLNAAPSVAVNDMVYVYGTTGTYGNIIQFTSSATISAASSTNYDGNPTATVITEVPNYSTGYHISTYLQYTGALTKTNSNYYINVGGTDIQISYPTTDQANTLTALDGKTVHVKGYFSGINSSSKFTTMLESVEEVAEPAITLAQYEYNLNADGSDAELPVTYTNMPADPQAVVIFYEANGETPLTVNPTWITASINSNYNIAGHIDVNEGDARTAYFKVKGIDSNNNEIYSNLVTINQAAAGATIEFNQTSMTLDAGGESDRKLSFDYSGLGNNPTFSINYYEQDGTTAANYDHDWLTATFEDNKVNISAVANTGEARSVYFRVYGENGAVNTESNLVTITQAAYVVDYATLPFSWAGNTSAPTGITNNGVGTYSSSPYLKFDGTGDYIILKINERPGTLIFDIKGNSFSGGTFKVQTSENGENYTDLKTYTTLGDTQNESFNTLGENVRYIKWFYTEKSSGNVALGNIALAVFDNTPSITAEDVNIDYDATEGSISYTINNPVEGGSMSSMPITGGDWLTVGGPSNGNVPLTCEQNTGAERTATVQLTYTYNTNQTVTKDVTVTQAGIPVATYVVNFNLDDGTFVPNEDFPQDVVEKEAGTYTLPSATKAGYDFTGWNDGDQTYAAGDEYTVSADVDFTAQWTESTTGTIVFGTNNVKINATEVSGDDSMGNTWTITTEGTSSFTQNAAYSQVGSGSSPATSITFTMTLPQQKTISAFEAKFGGFSNTAGDINLYVGETNVGSGELDATNDVTVEANTTTEVGTVLTVTVTNIAKGVKCYYISYTLSDAPVVPVIDATAGSALAYNATAGSIIYEIANYEAGTMTATTTADWINALVVTTPTAEDGEVTFNVTENTSNESRSATVTLTFTYGDPAATVTKDVTVTQNGTPSITVTPATANVAFAGGAPDFAVTYESLDIDNASDFDVAFYETSTSTTSITKPDWITSAVISGNTTDGFTMTVTVAANDGAAREAYLKVYAFDENIEPVYSGLVTISQAEHTQLATYSLVTSVDDIVSGKHYIIASSATDGDAYAMGGQTSNNRSGVAVIIDNSQITETEDVYEFVINTHETSSKDVVYTIYDAATPGYLYAASSSKNYLRTKTTLDDNGKWTIAIAAEGSAASIVAQGSNTRNNMKFNSSDGIFSCYASGQSPIYLYVKDNDIDLEYYGGEVAYPENSIPAGGSITVGAGSVLTVPTGFTNTDPNAFIIQDGGQVIYNGTGTFNATLQENITAYSNEPGVSDGWYLIASPVDNLPTSAVATAPYDLYMYSEPDAMWYSNTGNGAPFSTFTRGIGYLYANANDMTLNFTGSMIATNTTNIEVNMDYTSSLDDDVRGFNLAGNPFTRNLVDGDITIQDEGNPNAYYITEGGSNLSAQMITETPIKPGQGFMIQVSGENHKLIINPSAKDVIEDRGYIKIVAGNENGYDNAFIQINNGNTLRKLNIGYSTSVYVMSDGDDYAAARVEELAGTMPVNFEAVEDGEYTITVEAKFIEAHSMHLIDNFTGADIDLMVEPSYTFNATANDNAERFTLVFDFNNYTGCNENYTSENFIYQNGDEIIVNGEGTLQIFDVLGRLVTSKIISGVERIGKPEQTGVYIFRLNEHTQKLIIK